MTATVPLKRVASLRASNVDKKSVEGDAPVRLCNYTDVYYRGVIRPDQDFMSATASGEQLSAFRLKADDVLITKDSETADDIGIPAYVEAGAPDLVCGYHLALIRPTHSLIDGRFLYWSMTSTAVRKQFEVAATGVTRFGLRADSIGGVHIRCPALPEQRMIADFLDAETARIDALIGHKREYLSLLDNRVLALLDGLIAEPLAPLRRLAVVQGGVTVDAGRDTGSMSRKPYLRVANVQDGWLDLSVISEIEVSAEVIKRSTLRRGDVVMTEANGNPANIGRGTVWHGEIPGCLHQNHVFAIRVDQARLVPDFLALVTQSGYGRQYFRMVASQVGIATISKQKLLDFLIPVLPVAEQMSRVETTTGWLNRIREISVRVESQIRLLHERRQAVVTAAVTGQLEVLGRSA